MLSHLQKIYPLTSAHITKLSEVLNQLNTEQKLWLSGFLAGQATDLPLKTLNSELSQTEINTEYRLTILYGSQTGNAKLLAENYLLEAKSQGINADLISLAQFKPRQILKESNIVLIVSTHGEGDAPDDAEIFHEYLFSKNAPKLNQLNFSVLALGDSNYEKYCQTGIDFDLQFEKLGAQRIVERVDCDLDFEASALQWQSLTIKKFAETLINSENESNVVPLSILKNKDTQKFNRHHPFVSEILSIEKLTTEDSIKNIAHIELSIEDSGLDYLPGDSLAVIANNQDSDVTELLNLLDLNANDQITHNGQVWTLSDLLKEELEISLINRKFLNYYANLTDYEELKSLINSHSLFTKFVSNRQLIDVFKEFPFIIQAQSLVDHLPSITPRLYSIASSHKACPDEVHLTVALIKAQNNRTGLASGHLCRYSEAGDKVKIYIENNHNFKLPESAETPIIMIGPGTGVAPFRAFLQERQALGHTGKNWLFFGNPSFNHDFLYQLEWQDFIKSNILNKIDLAFSRDQQDKVYVQHKLHENAQTLWNWIEDGAHVYVCGDKNHMANDVEIELIDIIEKMGNKSHPQAQEYLKQLKRNKRYQKDVY